MHKAVNAIVVIKRFLLYGIQFLIYGYWAKSNKGSCREGTLKVTLEFKEVKKI
jgi:hypothetical protein